MVSVIVHHSFNSGTANIDQSLKSLQRKMQREAVVREMKVKRYHEKPSCKRKRRLEESNRRRRKINKKVRMDVSYRNFVLHSETSDTTTRDVGHSGGGGL